MRRHANKGGTSVSETEGVPNMDFGDGLQHENMFSVTEGDNYMKLRWHVSYVFY